MTSYAFIFARGGSKGIPGKNIKPLLGKPLIQYSIEVALQTSGISKVFVSTDDVDIAKVAEFNGAIVIDRPSELAQDDSPEWLAWVHAVNWVNEQYGDFEEFVSLPATSPLRTTKDVKSAMLKRVDTGADVCITIAPASRSPYFNMVNKFSDNFVRLVCEPDSLIFRRQDSPEVFDITTVAYVVSSEFIKNNNNIFDGNVTSVVIPKYRAIDIDDIYDFQFAESILINENIK
jgi:N-acylneuraminate cytidylyltransferase